MRQSASVSFHPPGFLKHTPAQTRTKKTLATCHSEGPVKRARVFFSARVGPRNLLRCSSRGRRPSDANSQQTEFPLILLRLLRLYFLHRHLLGNIQRLLRGNFNVRLHAGSFPIRLRDRIDWPREWHPDHEVIVDPMWAYWMRATTSGLADDRCPLQVLEVVSELLGAGKRSLRGQYEHWLACHPFSRHVFKRPILLSRIRFAVVHIIQMCRLVKEIGGDICHHLWIAAS